MRKITILLSLLLLVPTFGRRALAQQASQKPDQAKPQETAKAPAPPANYYHLEFVIEELDAGGKPVNSRTYTTTVSTDHHEPVNIRSDSQIPIPIGGGQNGEAKQRFQYEHVEVSIEVLEVHGIGRQLAIDNLSANVDSLGEPGDPNLHAPVTRDYWWEGPVLMPIGKPTVAFRSDDLDSKGSMQLIVTATPVE